MDRFCLKRSVRQRNTTKLGTDPFMGGGALGFGISVWISLHDFGPLFNILLQGLTQGFLTAGAAFLIDSSRGIKNTNFYYFDKFATGFAWGSAAAMFTDLFGIKGLVTVAAFSALFTFANDLMDSILNGEKINWAHIALDTAVNFFLTLLTSAKTLAALGSREPSEVVNAWDLLDSEEGESTATFTSWFAGSFCGFAWTSLFDTIDDLWK